VIFRAIALALGGILLSGSAALAAEPAVVARQLAPVTQPKSFPIATDVRLGGDDTQIRFVVDLSEKVDLAVFTLADPYRVVIDLPRVTFKLPAQAGEHGHGLVKAFRYGLIMQGGSRIVLDGVEFIFQNTPGAEAPAEMMSIAERAALALTK